MNLTEEAYRPPASLLEIDHPYADPPGNPEPFLIGEIVRDAWRSFVTRTGLLVGVTVAMPIIGYLATLGFTALATVVATRAHVEALSPEMMGTIAGQLLGLVVQSLLGIGATRITLAAARGRTFPFRTLFSGIDVLLSTIAASVLTLVFVTLGTLMFVVPGIIVALSLQMGSFVVADRGLGPIEALRESFGLTYGYRTKLLALGFVCFGILVLGVLAVGVGLAAAIPITSLVTAHAYLRLRGETNAESD